jgi:hypothetical protein
MRKILTFGAALAMAALTWGAETTTTPATKKAPAKKPAVASVAKKAPSKSAAVKPGVATKKPSAATTTASAKRGVKKAPATTWRNRQTSPTSDRYKEIQDALVAKGYLPSEEATGNWGEASADALKKFQAEETLETTGKINALSLIALGLGPKHDSLPARPAEGIAVQMESGRN